MYLSRVVVPVVRILREGNGGLSFKGDAAKLRSDIPDPEKALEAVLNWDSDDPDKRQFVDAWIEKFQIPREALTVLAVKGDATPVHRRMVKYFMEYRVKIGASEAMARLDAERFVAMFQLAWKELGGERN